MLACKTPLTLLSDLSTVQLLRARLKKSLLPGFQAIADCEFSKRLGSTFLIAVNCQGLATRSPSHSNNKLVPGFPILFRLEYLRRLDNTLLIYHSRPFRNKARQTNSILAL